MAPQKAAPARNYFNPRAREGRDYRTVNELIDDWEFQSTRPRGARPKRKRFGNSFFQFQSTRPRGARPSIATP